MLSPSFRPTLGHRLPAHSPEWIRAAGLSLVLAATLPLSAPHVVAAEPAAAAAEPAEGDSLDAQWKALMGTREKLVADVTAIREKFEKADAAEQQVLIKQYRDLQQRFSRELLPKLAELAPKVYAADPKNVDAGEAALELAFQQNQYDQAVEVGQKLLAAGHSSALTQNLTGVSLFAVHEFAKALEVFSKAEEAGELNPQLGGRYAAEAANYIDLWKQEQAIRAKEAALPAGKELPQVLFKTNKGDILLELFEDQAPNTVANFISLVEAKTYDGVKFHRVIPQFMVQGGDPLSKDANPNNDGTGGPGYVIDCECYRPDARKHFRGSLSMAHAGKDSGGSQFFLTHLPTPHLNPNPAQETGHTVFGRVVEGQDVVEGLAMDDEIVSATVVRKRAHEYKPETHAEK